MFAANEALAQGHGGVTATSIATGLARSTIDRGIQELRSARNDLGARLRRPGAERKDAVTQQPDLPAPRLVGQVAGRQIKALAT